MLWKSTRLSCKWSFRVKSSTINISRFLFVIVTLLLQFNAVDIPLENVLVDLALIKHMILKYERQLPNKIKPRRQTITKHGYCEKDTLRNSVASAASYCFSVSTNTDKNTISDICDDPRQILRYHFNGKQCILVCCSNNWIRFYGSASFSLLRSCITYLPPSVLSIFLPSTSPEEVIHRSGNLAVFSLSPASSPSVTWLKTDVGVINRRQRKPGEPPQYHT